MAPPAAEPVVPLPPVAPVRDHGTSALTIGKWTATGGALALIGTGIGLYFVSASYARTSFSARRWRQARMSLTPSSFSAISRSRSSCRIFETSLNSPSLIV
jgi:hypothetical protein